MKPWNERLEAAAILLEDGEVPNAVEISSQMILEKPEEVDPIILSAIGMFKAGRVGIAMILYEAALHRVDDRAHVYSNMACCLVQHHPEAALRLLETGLKYDEKSPTLLANMCSAHLALGNYAEALSWAKKCLEIDPDNADATYNSSLALLGIGAWEKGWQRYDVSLGNRYRKEVTFNEHEVRWKPEIDGGVDVLCVYGEQGLGDEVMFASMLERLNDNRKNIIIQCDPKLEGLFRRSFPWALVSGTRGHEWCDWYEKVEAKLEIGGLGNFFAPEPFRQEKYLEADPQRRVMWRAMFDQMGKRPKIGIAWNGGSEDTGSAKRSIPLEMWDALIDGVDADFVSLEYRDGEKHPKVHEFKFGTQTKDYDDTAAMVCELDLIIAVTTTVVDLCGALGKECWALVPSIPPWRYAHEGEKMHFYDSVKVFRQADGDVWPMVLDRVQSALKDRLK